jgi:RNA polymerase sigma-70 factor (ECF subfamily)
MPLGQSVEATNGDRPVRTAAPSAASDSDLNLIQAFCAGNESAFDRLFLKHQDYVYNVCLGILGNADDARDCTQETFLRVYAKVREFRAQAAFSTWLYRVAVNVCVGQLRKRPKQATASLEDENVREIPDDAPAPWVDMEREVDGDRVRAVVAELPENYRVVLVLRYFQNLSYEQMMEVLGFSLTQVKVKLHRARRAFAKRWAAHNFGAV